MTGFPLQKIVTSFKNILPHFRARSFGRYISNIQLAEPVVSFTFDDFPESAVTQGAKILGQYNLKGTFYISFGLCGKETSVGRIASIEQISSLIGQGHELGCHTYSHVDAWVSSAPAFKESIELNRQTLNRFFPQLKFLSFAYPKGSATPLSKAIVEEEFVTGRGIYWGYNKNRSDQNLLLACELYCKDIHATRYRECIRLIDRCIREKGWLIFFTHDVSESPGAFGCTPDVLRSLVEYCVRNGMAVKSVKDVISKR